MSSDELSLTWDEHHNTLVKVFGKLLKTSSLVDCTIAAEGQYIKAHKIILSACSPYFELLFNQEKEKNPIVVLKDVKFQELKAIIDFVYCGKVRVSEDRLGDFVDAAESLQIKGLGGDNYKAPNSGRISEGSKSPHSPKHEFSNSSSPVRRKHRRPASINEDNVSELSSGTNVNDEYQSIECVQQSQMQLDRLSHEIGQHSSIASMLNSLCSASVSVHSIQRIVETGSPTSFAEPSPSPPPPLEMLPNPDVMVIKTEPEPIAEVCLPETDFEPKGEEDVEDTMVLDSGDEVPGAVLNEDTQTSSHQYTALPTALQTAAASPDNAFVMTDVADHTSTRGADETCARGCKRGPPATKMQSADISLEVLNSALSCPTAVASLGAAVATEPPVDSPGSSSETTGQSTRKRPFCRVCGMTFRALSNLATHLRMHRGDLPFKCEQCGKTFRRKATLQSHMRIHTGERPFICDYCGNAFAQMSTLQRHWLVHTGERPFKCGQCGKDYTLVGNLQRHQVGHTGERPFKCEQCGKAFKRMDNLHAHQRIHAGERPFRCDECGVTTTQLGSLYQHMRNFHGAHGAPPPARRGPRV